MSAHAVAHRRRYGPDAIGDDIGRFWRLTLTLGTTEFKLRYFGSALGYLWSLMRPLLMFGLLYVVFTQIFNANKNGRIHNYGVYLLTGIMLWTFFAETTGASVQCLIAREGLLRKMRFPRLVIPLSVALTSLFNLAMNFLAVFAFALASGVYPRLSWLELPVLIVLLAFLAIGAGMLLSVLFVRFRDIQPIWDVISQMLFYGSPIIYTAMQYKGLVRVFMCNPIAAILTQMGKAFVDPSYNSAAVWIGGSVRLLIPLGLIALVFTLGLWLFNREAPRIAENL